MDVKRLARFTEPGHRATNDRATRSRRRDHDCLTRALRFYAQLGLDPPDAVMTDNAFVYTNSRRFRALLTHIGANHITPPPFTPRWNGKAERFIRTLQDEWAYAHT